MTLQEGLLTPDNDKIWTNSEQSPEVEQMNRIRQALVEEGAAHLDEGSTRSVPL